VDSQEFVIEKVVTIKEARSIDDFVVEGRWEGFPAKSPPTDKSGSQFLRTYPWLIKKYFSQRGASFTSDPVLQAIRQRAIAGTKRGRPIKPTARTTGMDITHAHCRNVVMNLPLTARFTYRFSRS
jgi:hypothetical protein